MNWRWIAASILILIVAATVALAVSVASLPQVNWRTRIVVSKLGGELSDVDWSELIWMLRPGSSVYLGDLANTRNPYASIRNPLTSGSSVEAGAELFKRRCLACHGPAGANETKVDLSRGVYSRGDSDWALYRVIGRGVPGTAMEGQVLASDELWQLVAFVRSLAKEDSNHAVQEGPTPEISLSKVTPARLIDASAEPESWLTYSGTYDGHRYSRLSEIDRDSVSRLEVEWAYQMVTIEQKVEATPLVVDGVMYLVEPPNTVLALDAASGRELWKYERALPVRLRACCARVNRGVALLGDRVFMATLDAHLVALDARTGRLVWDTKIEDNESGYSATAAPLAIGDKILVGISGGEFGIRGFVDAYDAASGERVWRFYTIPEPGEAGSESWEGDSWKTGGGATWVTGSYNSSLNLVYWGVGNPWPDFEGSDREGDNLYTNSVIALDADTGELEWHFQFLPHDLWDYDANAVPVLVDGFFEGVERKMLVMALKNGFAYLLDQRTGEFLRAVQISRQSWAERIDEYGRPIVNQAARPSARGSFVYPGSGGGANWWPPSFSPRTGLIYIPVRDRGNLFFAGSAVVAAAYMHANGELILGSTAVPVPSAPGWAALRAFDVTSGEPRWEVRIDGDYFCSGTLTTAGGLVFWADDTDFLALDSETGGVLWRFNTGGRINAAPMTFAVDGEQYVSIASGRSIVTFGLNRNGTSN